MELTPEQRDKIYREEKEKRGEGSKGSSSLLMYLFFGLIIGAAGYFAIRKALKNKEVSLEDLRKAYPGLSPDEEE